MKYTFFLILFLSQQVCCTSETLACLPKNVFGSNADSLPKVLRNGSSDLISASLREEAACAFRKVLPPKNLSDWENRRIELREFIAEKTALKIFSNLPLACEETGVLQKVGYQVKNISFQTRPSVRATANLYVPDGKGLFPAVLVMMGHSRDGKFYSYYQAVGQALAKNGYVALLIDPWGAGERTTIHGEFEYHGANLGASLMNVGETLMGMQLSDNIRAVDLLCSLPYVDDERIGATGASGGGNQTMWLAALDERIKAAIPVVSVGTFESYVVNSNCVCELLPDGLTFLEESEVLGLIAPRKLGIFNAIHDVNRAFQPKEMFRSLSGAKKIYQLYNVESSLSYRLFNTGHGYRTDMRNEMIVWFDNYLRGIADDEGSNYTIVEDITPESLMVFDKGHRPRDVWSTAEFCQSSADSFRRRLINAKNIDTKQAKLELEKNLRIESLKCNVRLSERVQEGGWHKLIVETDRGRTIPLLAKSPGTPTGDYVLVIHSEGKSGVPYSHIHDFVKKGYHVILADLYGTGEVDSDELNKLDGKLPKHHTLSRSLLWLGRTMIGEWVNDIQIINKVLREELSATSVSLAGFKEAGVATIFAGALDGTFESISVYDAPLSFRFDTGGDTNYYNMAVHVPNILPWGDITLAIALCDSPVSIYTPRSITGQLISAKDLENEKDIYRQLKTKIGKTYNVNLRQNPD